MLQYVNPILSFATTQRQINHTFIANTPKCSGVNGCKLTLPYRRHCSWRRGVTTPRHFNYVDLFAMGAEAVPNRKPRSERCGWETSFYQGFQLLLSHCTTSRVAATCAWRQPLRGMLGMLSPTLSARCGEQPHPCKSDRDVVFVR